MDRVCRTCMRIIDVNEEAVSLSDPDIRKKLEQCLPELVFDNVVDPKMCTNCSNALSFTFRFKDMCNETDKTINSCIESKGNTDKEPLNEEDLLLLGRRDVDELIIEEALENSDSETLETIDKIKRPKRRNRSTIAINMHIDNVIEEVIASANKNAPNEPVKTASRRQGPKLSLKPVETLTKLTTKAVQEPEKPTDKTLEEMLQEITGEICSDYISISMEHEPAPIKPTPIKTPKRVRQHRRKKRKVLKWKLGPSIKELEGIDLDILEINDGGENEMEILAALSTLPVAATKSEYIEKPEPPLQSHSAPTPVKKVHIDEKILFDNPNRTNKPMSKIQTVTHSGKHSSLTCEHCGRVFKYISELNIHKRAHILFKPFSCELCGKTFSLERYLAVHMALHISASHLCKICNKYFSSYHVLKKHHLTHTGERPFGCTLCDRRFNQRVNLETHMRTHTGAKDYICFICNTAFGQKVHLASHVRSHTGDKPFSCDLCSRTFIKCTELRYHKNSHIARPFMCSTCHSLFKDDVSYQRHIKKMRYNVAHNTNKTCRKIFKCGVCNKGYTTKLSRIRHMQSHVKALNTEVID